MPRAPRRNIAREPKSIAELVERVGLEVRRMGAQTMITSQVIAERFGIHTTDLECLDLILMQEQVSAGDLARATGLTSGAVTALIDRLEKAGYVTRATDPNDRRRQQVRVRDEAIEPIQAVYAPLQTQMFKLWSSFSVRELELIENFISRSTDLAVRCVESIRAETESGSAKRSRPRTSTKS